MWLNIKSARSAALVGLLCALPFHMSGAAAAELVEVRKIWDRGAHNAFTDLVRWRDAWWCTFREGADHVGGDGIIRVLTSRDGGEWESAAAIAEKDVDLRDPKLSVTPDGRLMLLCGGSVYLGTKVVKRRQPRVCFSRDGRSWTTPTRVLAEGDWLWRVTWHEGVAYGVSYRSLGAAADRTVEWEVALYRSRDGVAYELVKALGLTGRPNETTLRFEPDGTMRALVRREAGGTKGFFGYAKPPYTDWTWKESTHRFGGQDFLRIPDGRWMVVTRDYTNVKQGKNTGPTTIVAELGPEGQLSPLLTLPSGGDTSYPGLVWHDGLLWVSYYASHEEKSAIYLAKVRF